MASINVNKALKELNDENNRLWAQFRSKRPDHLLECKHEDFEWKFEEALDEWWKNGQDEFNELVAKHVGLKNKNFENMRVRTYYWSKTHKCKCSEKLRPCCHTCHNGKIYFEEDLDNFQIFIDNFYANGIKNIYSVLRDNYLSIIGYSKKKASSSQCLIRHF